ncbi:hypothetical protein FHS42_003466 [Streptomyces zagrosensis]|uniref:Tc1-like transposase DDE domain-containing protein n=1 Tax=Streptomyces zagrosensis TaxID=1042984 RepID=A0A7W9UZH5_9ACTN|nr:hypothetical protein [Streptomyces zagrosensis]
MVHITPYAVVHSDEYADTDIRRWAKKHEAELCFTPTYASWANPIEAHFGPLRQFTPANSHHPNHPVQTQTQALHACLRWPTPPPAIQAS